MPEERKLVTVLFADIVGSTPLTGEHDPEVIRSALDAAFEDIAPVIRDHGGTVEKFIGDAVMAVFGVPRAHDDDAERAMRAAFAIRDLAATLGGPLPLHVRVGVSTGEVVTRSDAGDQRLVTGIAVNLAQRLQSAAAPGEILAGDLTSRLTQRSVRYGPSRIVEAKGIGEVAAWSAEMLVSAVPDRRLSTEGIRPPLIDRHDELRRLHEVLERIASERQAVIVTLVGTAGVGKTRLAEDFLAGLDPAGVLRGRCLPYGEGAAAYPVQQMLRVEAGIDLGDSREAAAQKLRARVAEVIGADEELEALQRRVIVHAGVAPAADELAHIATGDVAEELRWAFRRYVERRAASGPAVLLFEDIHWAAPTFLDLIEHLADWSRAPLLLLCLARPELREARPGWLARRRHAVTIELEPLDPRDTSELIRALLPVAPPSEILQKEVIARSEGNPLYVEEFVRALIETGQIIREEGRWVPLAAPTISVPMTLHGLIAARLDRVSTDAKRVLEEAAVIGRTFSSSALTVLHTDQVASALREAVDSEVIAEVEAWTRGRGALYRFRHVLFREVAYGMLPKADRSLLHDRYRQWLEETAGERRDDLIEVIADHAEQAHRLAVEVRSAEVHRLARIAFDRLRNAAERTREHGDLRTSLDLCRRAKAIAKTLVLSDAERIELEANLLLLRTSFERGDEVWADVEDLLERARSAGPSEPFVRLLIVNGRRTVRAHASSIDRSANLLEEALAAAKALGDPELITHALVQLPIVPQAHGDLREVSRLLEEALAYARSHSVRRELSACLDALAEWAIRSGAFTRATELLAEADQVAQERGSKAARFAALFTRAHLAIWTGPWDDALAHVRRLEPLVQDLATTDAHVNYWNLLGQALLEAGDPDGARAAHAAAIAMTEPESFEFVYSAVNMVLTLIALGELTEARRLYETIAPIDLPWQNYLAMNATVAAALHAAEGNVGAAEALYRRAIAIFEEATTSLARWHWAQQLYAELLLREGRFSEARPLLEEVRDFFSDPLAKPRRAKIEALLARTEGAPAGL